MALPAQHGKVLVLGSDTRSFLAVIRSLGRRNIQVDVAWCGEDSPALRSRYVHHRHLLPPPEPDGRWKRPMLQLLERERFDLVIPCNDPSLIPLQEHRGDFERYPLYLLNDKTYRLAFDKSESDRVASSLRIPVPRGIVVEGVSGLPAIESLVTPLVLKPVRSYLAHALEHKNRVLFADTTAEAGDMLTRLLKRSPVLVQEYFDGVGVGVEFIAHNGQPLVTFQHVRLHEPPSGGGSSYRRSTVVDPALGAATQRLIESLNYTGVGMVEFRYNFRTGKWIFVEINGRFWGSLPLAIACGADFPRYLYEMLVEGKRQFPRRYRRGLCSRHWVNDLNWFRQSIASVGLNLVGQLGLIGQVLADLRHLLLLQERSDTLVWDDPKPALRELRQLCCRVWVKVSGTFRRVVTHWAPLRGVLRRRATRRIGKDRTIVFVCKGNICRSPFAQYYAQQIFPASLKFESCGYYPVDNRPCPEQAVRAAERLGVSLSDHRSRLATAEMLDRASVIFTFDEENSRMIRHRFPASRRKTFDLGVMVSAGDVWIPDPYSGTQEEFHRIYARIKQVLDRCAITVALLNEGGGVAGKSP